MQTQQDLNKNNEQQAKEMVQKEKERLEKEKLSQEAFLDLAHKIREKLDEENLDWFLSTDANASGRL